MEVHALRIDKTGRRARAQSRLERLVTNSRRRFSPSLEKRAPFILLSVTMKLAIISSVIALSCVWLVAHSLAVAERSLIQPLESNGGTFSANASIPIRSLEVDVRNSTFDSFNSQCRSVLCGKDLDKPTLDLVKPEGFNCCIGRASSLVLKWHAPCAGNISIVTSSDQSTDDCGLRVQDPDTYRLVDCACYRRLLNSISQPTRFNEGVCQLSHSMELSSSREATESDSYGVCLVSVAFDAETARRSINWSQPLPTTIGLQHSSFDRTTRTYFETSCSSEWLEGSYFGKWTNSCPRMGHIDAEGKSTKRLNRLVYAELIDGTSSDLVPDVSAAPQWFDPTFAGCSCVKQTEDLLCGDSLIAPTEAPSSRFVQSTILPTRQFHGGELNESTRQPLHIPSCRPVLEASNEPLFPTQVSPLPPTDPPASISPSSESSNRPRTPSPFVTTPPGLQAKPSKPVDHLTMAPYKKFPPPVQSVSSAPSAAEKPSLPPKPSLISVSVEPSPRPKSDESLFPSGPSCAPFMRHQRPTRSIGPIPEPQQPRFPDATIHPSRKPVVATTNDPNREFSPEASKWPHASPLHPSNHAITFVPTRSPSRIPTTTPSDRFSPSETAGPSSRSIVTAKPSSSLVSSPSFISSNPANKALSNRPSEETSQLPSQHPSHRRTLHPSIGPSGKATNHPTSGTSRPAEIRTRTPAVPASSRSPSGASEPRPEPPAIHMPLPLAPQPVYSKAPSMGPHVAPQEPTAPETRGRSGTPTVSKTIFPTARRTLLPSPSVVSTLVPVELPISVPTSSSPTRAPLQAPAPNPTLRPASSVKPTYEISRDAPTNVPWSTSTSSPIQDSTLSPTEFPSTEPSLEPTVFQSENPTDAPFVSSMPSSSIRRPMVLSPPALEPHQHATLLPTPVSTHLPSEHLTVAPSRTPTSVAVAAPTLEPDQRATLLPTPGPTDLPSVDRTGAPSQIATSVPVPVPAPTLEPNPSGTLSPTIVPTHTASGNPTVAPSRSPTSVPVLPPTLEPQRVATLIPTPVPTRTPSESPTFTPSQPPSTASAPTLEPSLDVTPLPTDTPTYSPSAFPTAEPSFSPTPNPTVRPSSTPTQVSTQLPTASPSQTPTLGPTQAPTPVPTSVPTPETWPEPVVVPGSECSRYQFSNCFFVASRNCHAIDASVANSRCYYPGPSGRRALSAADEKVVTVSEVLLRFEQGIITKDQIKAEVSRHQLLAKVDVLQQRTQLTLS